MRNEIQFNSEPPYRLQGEDTSNGFTLPEYQSGEGVCPHGCDDATYCSICDVRPKQLMELVDSDGNVIDTYYA